MYVCMYQETEQILIFPDGRISAFVQIRGSIPLKWSSPVHMKYEHIHTCKQIFLYIHTYIHTFVRYDPVVIIDTDRRTSNDLAAKHICEILDIYSDNTGGSGQAYTHTYILKLIHT